MINLIPPAAKKTVVVEYWVRVVSVWMVLFGTVCAVMAVFLLPTYMMVGREVEVMRAATEQNAASAASFDSSAAALTRAMAETRLLLASSTDYTLMVYEAAVREAAGDAIVVSELSLTRGATTTVVSVVGEATTRAALAAYREALEASPLFFDVNLPLSSLIKDRELPFSLTMVAHNTPQ